VRPGLNLSNSCKRDLISTSGKVVVVAAATAAETVAAAIVVAVRVYIPFLTKTGPEDILEQLYQNRP